MANLTVRKLDDDLYERLRSLARMNNRSVEAEARLAIAEHAPLRPDIAELIADLRAHQARLKAKYGVFSDSTEIIRQMREEE